MAFLNALGSVSRHGQWRLRRVLRARLPDGRLDLSDAGLIDFSTASEVLLTVTPRPPLGPRCAERCEHVPRPVLSASMSGGTLLVSNPGIIEALFPVGWATAVPRGFCDVRILMTVGPETACIFEQPVELR